MVRHVRHPLYTVIASPVTESQSQLDSHSDSRLRFSRKLCQLSHRCNALIVFCSHIFLKPTMTAVTYVL